MALSEGDLAAELASEYGLPPDEWQQGILLDWHGRRDDRGWAATRRGIVVPRQNGKNGVVEQDQLYKMTQLGRRILHTAHEVKTARKAFLRLESYFANRRRYPELADMVREIRRTNGQEAVVLWNGASCEFVARSRGSGRGFTVDDLYCDEAQELTDEHLAALLPTISAAPSGMPTTTMLGTPPPPELAAGPLARMRLEAHAGGTSRLAWHEWGWDLESMGTPDLDDPQTWARTNPGLGIRLQVDTVADERAAMDSDTFMRERLGMWSTGGRPRVITPAMWEQVCDPQSRPSGRVAFGIAVRHDHAMTTVGVAAERSDGRVHVGIAARQPGTAWVVGWAAERDKRWRPVGWAINPAAQAGMLIAPLARARKSMDPILISGHQWATACGALLAGVQERTLRHAGTPELAASVDGASKIPLGALWQWHPADPSADITGVQAVTLALAALGHKRARRPRTGRALAV